HGLRAMETGEPLVLRLLPDEGDGDPADAMDGAVVERNPCLSGGALEIFLEPHLPPARLVVIGGSPIAEALARVAGAAGYDCERAAAGDGVEVAGAGAVIVASHGNDEEAVLEGALRAGIPYVALVASRRRGEAVRAGLRVESELAAQLHTPAGLDIGARSPGEIAVAILADIIARRYADPAPGRPALTEANTAARPVVAIDPVCGMQVAVAEVTPQLRTGGETVYFCSGRCRDAYAAQHAAS
ncbi:MAG TPA: XdhC family protein, partial [Solirubrobacteraceae bacterium]|nr:XdhC family protein [Solirubrobacteraceae bacterium]